MLDDVQKARLMELFAEASEIRSDERPAFVEQACAGDDLLRHELAALLEIEVGDFLTEPAVAAPDTVLATTMERSGIAETATVLRPPGTAAPPEIEGYADFEHIADGGMGAVFKARQLRPVQRTVAIKLIRRGMDSSTVLARFEAERQALALMSHPYIATVYDAGTDSEGHPFISMELAEGLPITDFCEAERLSLNERLQLFIKVCRAVDHAHRRGVLHRDLKPSNILVSRSGDEVIPKVIDFGIAKALEEPLGELSIHTLAGSFVGTPEYMSPEQIEGDARAADTRSDVYSLGVVLYELLACARPFSPEKLRRASMIQWTKIVRDEVPPKPSTRLRGVLTRETRDSPDGLLDRSPWLRKLEGDLDWVVMKALEKEPERRYASPHELGTDVGNYLADRPVTAGPPSGAYRFRKFVQRYRIQVTAAALVLFALIVGLFGTIWFLFEARDNEIVANRRATEAIAAKREADGVRLAAEAALLAEESPNLALLLALEASKLTGHHSVNQTVHRVLPFHSQIALLDGHDHAVAQLLFLADGRLLSRGFDNAVLLWDVDLARVLRRFRGHTDVVEHMATDSSEDRLLTVSKDGSARVWDLDSGRQIACTAGNLGRLTSCAFAADGRRFAVTSIDSAVARVFDASTGAEEFVLRGHRGAVTSAAFDPSGTHIATRGHDRSTRIWSRATGAVLRVLAPGSSTGKADELESPRVDFSPRGDRIVSSDPIGGSATSLLVDSIDGERLLEVRRVIAYRFLDEDRLFFATHGKWGIVALATGTVIEERALDEPLSVREASRDAKLAIVVDKRRDACLYDLVANKVVRRYRGKSYKSYFRLDVAFHPDGKRVAVSGKSVRVWNLQPEFESYDLPEGARPVHTDAVVSGREPLVLAWDEREGQAAWSVWDIGERRRVVSLPQRRFAALRVSPCGTKIVAIAASPETPAAEQAARAVVLDLTGRVLREFAIAAPDKLFGLRRDGRLLRVNRWADKRSYYYDLETGEALSAVPIRAFRDWHASPNGEFVVLRGSGGTPTELHDRETGARIASVSYPGTHTSAAVSPDGRLLLVTAGDKDGLVWDLTTARDGAEPRLVTHYKNLLRADWKMSGFAAGGRLAWVRCSNEVHVFDAVGGKPYTVLRLDGRLASVATSADGRDILTATQGGRVQRWPVDTVAVAKRLAVDQLDPLDLEMYGIGTEEERRMRERAWLAAHPTPRHLARLGMLDRAADDLDSAIRHYGRAFDLGPLPRTDVDVYLSYLDVLCRRLDTHGISDRQLAEDREKAIAALEHALRCGATTEEVETLQCIGAVRSLRRVRELMPR